MIRPMLDTTYDDLAGILADADDILGDTRHEDVVKLATLAYGGNPHAIARLEVIVNRLRVSLSEMVDLFESYS